MRVSPDDVVITGVGVVSPYGLGVDAFFDGLLGERGAAAPIRQFDASQFPTTIAAEVPHFDMSAGWLASVMPGLSSAQRALLERCELDLELRDRKLSFALIAAYEAWRMASCDRALGQATMTCLGLGLERAFLEDFDALISQGLIDWSKTPEGWGAQTRIRSRVSLSTARVASLLSLGQPSLSNVSACAAGAMAIAQGAAWIRRGRAERVLCGGADAMINPLGLGGMARLGAPSPRAQVDACRPFDLERDGLLMGEGAAIFVLERASSAAARGAAAIARVEGWGVTQDGWRTTAPREDGQQAALAMSRALECAQLAPEQIGYINAHGTGTPLNDPAEAQAILRALGQSHGAQVPVSSIKGAIGHWMAASGAAEAVASLLPFMRGLMPGTLNHSRLDPACPIHVLGPKAQPADAEHVMSNSFGFGGQNVSLILGACP